MPKKDLKGISIHAPRTGSDHETVLLIMSNYISIHAPRTGSDVAISIDLIANVSISIHAPRTGSDVFVGARI